MTTTVDAEYQEIPKSESKKSKWEDFKQSAQYRSAKAKTRPDILAGRVIVAGAGVVVGLVIAANVAPYARLSNAAIDKALGLSLPWLGRLIGVFGLAAVQTGEVFSHTMHRPSRIAHASTGLISLFCYAIDAAIAIWAWSPLNVPIGTFIAVPLLSSINWINCIIIVVLLFGVEVFINLCKLVNRTNRSQD